MRGTGLVLAYHGGTATLGEAVLGGKEFLQIKENDYDWLGGGVYFWENDPLRAAAWANTVLARRKLSNTEKPFVLGAVIELGNCLDLTEQKSLQLVRDAHAAAVHCAESTGRSLPRNLPAKSGDEDLMLRKLDCFVINYLHRILEQQKQPAYDTVRSPFQEGLPLFAGSRIMAQNHVQLAVRNRRRILGYFRPLPEFGHPE